MVPECWNWMRSMAVDPMIRNSVMLRSSRALQLVDSVADLEKGVALAEGSILIALLAKPVLLRQCDAGRETEVSSRLF